MDKDKREYVLIGVIILAVGVAIGLIWGLEGYLDVLAGIAVIACILTLGGIMSGENSGCTMSLISGIIAIFSILGCAVLGSFIEEREESKKIEQAFEALQENTTRKELQAFLQEYPQSKRSEAVLQLYFDSYRNSVDDLEFISEKFKYTKFAAMAVDRINVLCDSLYAVAQRENSVEGWRRYRFLVGRNHYADSEEQIKKIEEAAWSSDSKAWQQAIAINTVAGYQKYLDLYPKGKFNAIADKKIIDIQVETVYAGQYGELPSMNKISTGWDGSSTIIIKNSTGYTLTLLYSGINSKRVVIAPQGSQRVVLDNGVYRIVASVSASNVRTFAGEESLSGGMYSVEYYISTSPY